MSEQPIATAATTLALVQGQAAAREQIAERVIRIVTGLYRAFAGWYSDAAVAALSQQVGDVVRDGQVVTGDLTDAYLARVLEVFGAPAPDRPVSLPGQLRGVEPAEVYQRPVKEYRYQRSLDVDEADALERAVTRAATIVEDDLTLAMREATRQRLRSTALVTGYRRVLHPELSRSGPCGLCAVASDRIYQVDTLLPIHDRCKCEPLPIIGDQDPGYSLNADDLKRIYEAAGSTKSADLKRVRVAIREHGELGPVLRRADHEFRTRREAVADLAPREGAV